MKRETTIRRTISLSDSLHRRLKRTLKFSAVLGGALLLLISSPALRQAAAAEFQALVDDHKRDLPGEPPSGWFYNAMGGDRGMINDTNDPSGLGVAAFSKPTPTTYRGTLVRLNGTDLWEFLGWWYSLGRPLKQKHQFNPLAVFDSLIRPEYQGQLRGAAVKVTQIQSPSGRSDLTLKLELKGFNDSGDEVVRVATNFVGRTGLIGGPFPRTFTLDIDPTTFGRVGALTVLLDRALPGDSLEVDDVMLRIWMPEVAADKEPLLFALAMLLENYDATTGMVQDRSNFPNDDFENVTATAKFAKLLACGIQAGIIDPEGGAAAITNIANALLTKVPRGYGNLWPHFTKSGGTIKVPGTEWASGDTAYAVLDLMVALRMSGDPHGQLPACDAFLHSINWQALRRPGAGFSHGYAEDGTLLPGNWLGFGMETLGVNLASLAGGGPLGEMLPPPTDNGSGFILHAGYPIVPSAKDRWGNDWLALRQDEVNRQLNWYGDVAHSNLALVQLGLFGLSAGESPEGWNADPSQIYQAYGLGGRVGGANDGDHKVVTLHYSGMIAPLNKAAALTMWNSLKNLGLVSPMNIVESMAVNPASAEIEVVNFLKGSWNLALFAEGWALTQPGVSDAVNGAARAIPSVAQALDTLFPAPNLWSGFTGLPASSSGYVFTGAAGHLVAGDTTPNGPRLWMSDSVSTNAVFTELPFNQALLTSSWSWAKQITSITTLRSDGVDQVYVGTSGGVFEVDFRSGTTNVLLPFWSWNWDSSYGLRAAGNGLVWTVGSYGSASGPHFWTPENGFHFLNWSDVAITNGNQLYSKSTGALFGWSDSRGFVWPGTNPPALLLQSASGYPVQSSYSTNGGATWQQFVYLNGDVVQAHVPMEAYGINPVFLVDQAGNLLIGSVGDSFDSIGSPMQNPSTVFFEENYGLLIAGNGGVFYATQLAPLSRAGVFQRPALVLGGLRLRLNARAGMRHRLEATADFLHWDSVATNTVSPAGMWDFIDTQAASPARRFYRAVLLD